MSNSSAPLDYSITSIDNSDTITLTGTDTIYNYATGSTVTIMPSTSTYTIGNTISVGAGTISGISSDTFIWKSPTEFIDSFPDWNRIEKMCELYPGLEIAFQKFKTTYYLVKDDYDNPKDKT
jgi:hypothetical protein